MLDKLLQQFSVKKTFTNVVLAFSLVLSSHQFIHLFLAALLCLSRERTSQCIFRLQLFLKSYSKVFLVVFRQVKPLFFYRLTLHSLGVKFSLVPAGIFTKASQKQSKSDLSRTNKLAYQHTSPEIGLVSYVWRRNIFKNAYHSLILKCTYLSRELKHQSPKASYFLR